jgi:hypothetical protein
LLGKAPSRAGVGLASMADGVLHLSLRQKALMRMDRASDGVLGSSRASDSQGVPPVDLLAVPVHRALSAESVSWDTRRCKGT